MLEHILVALDTVNLADHILAKAADIARGGVSRITIVQLLDQPSAMSRTRLADPLDWHMRKIEAQTNLIALAHDLREQGVKVDVALLEGSHAENLIDYVQAHRADLIVLSKQCEAMNELIHGLIKTSPIPILILQAIGSSAKQASVSNGFRKILLPLDGSQRAECALPLAVTLAQQCEAQLLLAHIVHRPEMPHRAPLSEEEVELSERITETNRVQAAKYLDQIAAHLPGEVPARLLVSDNIVATLHKLVQDEQIDLIVLSAHGYSGDPRWPLGSITSSLIAYSEKPVLVVQDLPTARTEHVEQPIRAAGKGR